MVPSTLKQLLLSDPRGCDFDLHDAYAVGVRQAVAVLRRQLPTADYEALDTTLTQFRTQRRSSDTLVIDLPHLVYGVQETTMCVAHTTEDALIQEGVERGRLLVFEFLIEEQLQRRLPVVTETEAHRAGMKAYAFLMDLAAEQLDPGEYEAWYDQWCQVPGQMPWALSEYAKEVYYVPREGWCSIERM